MHVSRTCVPHCPARVSLIVPHACPLLSCTCVPHCPTHVSLTVPHTCPSLSCTCVPHCSARVSHTRVPHACAHRAFACRGRGHHLMSLTAATFPAEPEAGLLPVLCGFADEAASAGPGAARTRHCHCEGAPQCAARGRAIPVTRCGWFLVISPPLPLRLSHRGVFPSSLRHRVVTARWHAQRAFSTSLTGCARPGHTCTGRGRHRAGPADGFAHRTRDAEKPHAGGCAPEPPPSATAPGNNARLLTPPIVMPAHAFLSMFPVFKKHPLFLSFIFIIQVLGCWCITCAFPPAPRDASLFSASQHPD